MIQPREYPQFWTDRAMLFRDNKDRNQPLEDRVKGWSDAEILHKLDNLTVVAFDPGGTTGWAVMRVKYADLVNQHKPVHECIHYWTHGQVDCGSQSGNAADSATANDYDLGISETGEAAGVAVLENIVICNAGNPTAVVHEDFILRTENKSRDALSPVRVTAALQQLLWELRATVEFKQQPSEAKTAITDARLKLWGMYHDGHSSRHARDADRHALLFLRKCRAKPSQLRKAYPAVREAKARGLL